MGPDTSNDSSRSPVSTLTLNWKSGVCFEIITNIVLLNFGYCTLIIYKESICSSCKPAMQKDNLLLLTSWISNKHVCHHLGAESKVISTNVWFSHYPVRYICKLLQTLIHHRPKAFVWSIPWFEIFGSAPNHKVWSSQRSKSQIATSDVYCI